MDEQNPATIYLNTLQAGTSRESTRRWLSRVVQHLAPEHTLETYPWANMEYAELVSLRSHLQENHAPNSANRALAAIRQIVLIARRLGLISAEKCTLLREIPGVRGEREPSGRALEKEEVQAMFQAAGYKTSQWHARRNSAMLVLLFGAGLRREEICQARRENLRQESDGQYVLVARGKGNKERTIPLPLTSNPALEPWLRIRGTEPGYLFSPRGQAEKKYQPEVFYTWVKRLARRAGMTDFSPHDGRRTYISNLLDNGADLAVVARLAGHAQVETTRRYDRRDVRSMKRAVNLISYPLSR